MKWIWKGIYTRVVELEAIPWKKLVETYCGCQTESWKWVIEPRDIWLKESPMANTRVCCFSYKFLLMHKTSEINKSWIILYNFFTKIIMLVYMVVNVGYESW